MHNGDDQYNNMWPQSVILAASMRRGKSDRILSYKHAIFWILSSFVLLSDSSWVHCIFPVLFLSWRSLLCWGKRTEKEYCSFRNRIGWVDDKFTDSLKLMKTFEKIYLIDLLEIRCSFYFPINQRSLFTKHKCQSSV